MWWKTENCVISISVGSTAGLSVHAKKKPVWSQTCSDHQAEVCESDLGNSSPNNDYLEYLSGFSIEKGKRTEFNMRAYLNNAIKDCMRSDA